MMMRELKLGSLFDGSGGFPLAGALNGIKPVWASEIEPFPIRVTKLRIPQMKHLGSVTDINGAEIEPVDIITFGSPCQDLSVAGKQMGIHEGQRSSLFFEAIRIIKEMREHDRATGRADDDVRPRFAVWENVPGAFSSNKGADFQAVLQAFCDIMEDGLHIPRPKKWNHAGCVAGNGWSLAWRVYDAQYWPGTPQRRKRVYLIADFGSERAGEILFERESVCGNPAKGREAGEGTAEDAEGSIGGSDCYAIDHVVTTGGNCTAQGPCYYHGICPTLKASGVHSVVEPAADAEGSAGRGRAFGIDWYNQVLTGEKSIPIRSVASDVDHIGAVLYEVCSLNDQGGSIMDVSDKAMALREQEHGHQPVVCVQNTGRGWWNEGEVAETLRTPCGGDSTKANLVVMLENHSNDSRVGVSKDGKCQTLTSRMGTGGGNVPMILMEVTDE